MATASLHISNSKYPRTIVMWMFHARNLAMALVLLAGAGLSHTRRVEGLRAVERARYAFSLNTSRPFDEIYPRSVFEKKVRRQEQQEWVLREQFGLIVTARLLAEEYERIERETRAPEQWEAIKRALGNDPNRVEEIFCRPILVEQRLRARFDFDQRIHAVAHQKAREARAWFIAGKAPSGSKTFSISRMRDEAAATEQRQNKSGAEAWVPPLPDRSGPPSAESPVPVDPEMAAVLQKELKKSGDVTTILEERTRFSVFRLQSLTESEWRVEAFEISKRDFEAWFQETLLRRSDSRSNR